MRAIRFRPGLVRLLALILVPGATFSGGCATDAKNSDKIDGALYYNDRLGFEQVMLSFIAKAKGSDIDGMLALTSKTVIAKEGRDRMGKLYGQKLIPVLRGFPNMAPGGHEVFRKDEHGHYGWVFNRTILAADGREATVQFGVFHEDGRDVITTVAGTRRSGCELGSSDADVSNSTLWVADLGRANPGRD